LLILYVMKSDNKLNCLKKQVIELSVYQLLLIN
jgi:hypothetical protein